MHLDRPGIALGAALAALLVAGRMRSTLVAQQTRIAERSGSSAERQVQPPHLAILDQSCYGCHDDQAKEAGLSLEAIAKDDVTKHADVWEKVIRKLRTRQMPPVGEPRPSEATYNAVITELESSLDRAAALRPNPGRTATIRRLTRTEYHNAIRDLLALDVNVSSLLPADDSSYGFDNVTVGDLSPTLLERYLSAAEKISKLAVGRPSRTPGGETFRMPPDLTQEQHVEGLPLGTRGGAVVSYTFPEDGEYDIQIRLMRDRDEHIEGLSEAHDVELLIDRARVQLFSVRPGQIAGPGEPPREADEHLHMRVPLKAGPHDVGATFLQKGAVLLEGARQPYQAHFNYYRHPRIQPAIYSISIVGPYNATGPGDTPSRRRLFITKPTSAASEERTARQILTTLMRRAYRRAIADADLQGPMALYRQGRTDGGFEAGIELALARVLVSPDFLFRVEADPKGLAPNTPYRVSDTALATRLSFFLWSSIPDDELLAAATAGRLHEPAVLERQVRRMLADARSNALVTNFAEQWLHLRNLDGITPDMRIFPDFDDNLRQAMRQETELFVGSVLHEDRSALDLVTANYSFLNERLARHYGIPNIYGDRFRRVQVTPDSWRGGLLRQGSILTVTSYATRTSPVIRGKWILDNLLGVPPPAPPPNVPALKDNTVDGSLPGRARLAEHRQNAACAGCHNLIDPVGLSLERFDAVGRRRTMEDGKPVDASGGLPDGSAFADVDGLERALLKQPDIFVSTLTEKLLTYALGRGVEYYDAPAVRSIVRSARSHNYKMSSIILGVVNSQPFHMRTSR